MPPLDRARPPARPRNPSPFEDDDEQEDEHDFSALAPLSIAPPSSPHRKFRLPRRHFCRQFFPVRVAYVSRSTHQVGVGRPPAERGSSIRSFRFFRPRQALVPKLCLGMPMGAKLRFARRECPRGRSHARPPDEAPLRGKAHSHAQLGNEVRKFFLPHADLNPPSPRPPRPLRLCVKTQNPIVPTAPRTSRSIRTLNPQLSTIPRHSH